MFKINVMKFRIFGLVLSAILFFNFATYSQDVNSETRKFNKMLTLIDAMYVDTVDMKKIVETAIVGMLKEMDPHSVYISADEIEKMKEPLEGSFEGIGVQFRLMEDTLLVVGVISGGPSEKVGILTGDRIVVVDDEVIAGVGIDNAGVAKRLRGKKGTVVKVEVVRRGEKQNLVFNITRDKIPIYSVDAAYVTKDKIGYVKLNKFAKSTTEELDFANLFSFTYPILSFVT
jgi:carboxyl-terminal processing protease